MVETFLEKDSHKRKLEWAQELLREAERNGTPEGLHRERKGKSPTISMWPCYVKSLIKNIPPMKMLHKRKNGRM